MSETKYRDFLRLTSAITRVVGIVGFVAVIVFWGITQEFESAILAGCIALTGIGQGLDVAKEIADTRAELRRIESSPPPPAPIAVPPGSQDPSVGTGEA